MGANGRSSILQTPAKPGGHAWRCVCIGQGLVGKAEPTTGSREYLLGTLVREVLGEFTKGKRWDNPAIHKGKKPPKPPSLLGPHQLSKEDVQLNYSVYLWMTGM